MSISNTVETDLLALLGNNTALPGAYGGSLYVALHTADPLDTGDQTTNEVSYTGYARAAVVRNSSGWTVTTGSMTNTNTVTLGAKTAGSDVTATHVSIGVASSGASRIIMSGLLNASLPITNGVNPTFNAGALLVTLD